MLQQLVTSSLGCVLHCYDNLTGENIRFLQEINTILHPKLISSTLVSAAATRSMAPPIPFTILPGIIQLARSPQRDTLNQFLDSEEVLKCPQRRKMSSHLHCSQDGKANVASPDHGKTLLAREERAAGDGCHCLLARVDQVGVNLWIARLA